MKYTEVPEEEKGEKGEKIEEGKDRYRVEEKDATRYAHRKKETIEQQKDHVWSQERYETQTDRSTTADHPGDGDSPPSDKDDGQDTRTGFVAGTDVVQYRDRIVRGVGAGIRVTL